MYTTICDPEIMKTMLPEDFPADKLSQPKYDMIVEKNVYVTMRDGIKVAVDVFRPDAEGEFPAIFMSTGYMKEMTHHLSDIPTFHFVETNDPYYFVSRGYVVTIQDQRGTGDSTEGTWEVYSEEVQNDLYDCIEWVAEQIGRASCRERV